MHFQFRLEKMLNFLRLKETVKKMEVAASIQKVHFLGRRREELRSSMRGLLEKSNANLQISMDWIYYQNSKIEIDLKETRRIEAMLSEENEELKRKKSELLRLTTRKKALESLREKRLKEFKLQQGRRIQKQLDEVYQLNRRGGIKS